MLQLFHYHPKTKIFTRTSNAKRDPLDNDRFLVPAFATEIIPPAYDMNTHAAIFNEETREWKIKEDHRNELVYAKESGEASRVESLGNIPEDYVQEPPTEGLIHPIYENGKWKETDFIFKGKYCPNEGELKAIVSKLVVELNPVGQVIEALAFIFSTRNSPLGWAEFYEQYLNIMRDADDYKKLHLKDKDKDSENDSGEDQGKPS